jgi:hypothetical protein
MSLKSEGVRVKIHSTNDGINVVSQLIALAPCLGNGRDDDAD